jgi:hypothetical protein
MGAPNPWWPQPMGKPKFCGHQPFGVTEPASLGDPQLWGFRALGAHEPWGPPSLGSPRALGAPKPSLVGLVGNPPLPPPRVILQPSAASHSLPQPLTASVSLPQPPAFSAEWLSNKFVVNLDFATTIITITMEAWAYEKGWPWTTLGGPLANLFLKPLGDPLRATPKTD